MTEHGSACGRPADGVIAIVPTPAHGPPPVDRSRARRAARRAPVLALFLLLPLLLFGAFGGALAPHDPRSINPSVALQPPAFAGGAWTHPLGTDHMGRDVLSRMIDGARNSLLVAIFGVALAGAFGTAVGMVAGYARGATEEVLMRIVDMQLAIPPILLAVLLAGVIGGGLVTVIATLTITFWSTYARIVRGETMGIMQREFIALARVAGAGHWWILSRHVLPNLLSPIVVLATLQLGAAVGLEAALTFLGLGIQPPDSAWGLMISDGRLFMAQAWWIPTVPGIAIVMTVLGSNLLGDWLRDRLDPRLRQL